ncbi:MAG: MotA/TolQ/ExbB proton channel family protein [Campylobacterota bacterium]|nr:MotA/TolQ/ExbB proton channel family protein [Campylobacterota bacterium]
MDILSYIDRGGIIVYILIAMNIIGFTIMLWKSVVLYNAKKNLRTISSSIISQITLSSNYEVAQIQAAVIYKVRKLESGLNTVKIIAALSPLLGLLGTVIGILNSFDSISIAGLGDPAVFSKGISIALITTVAGLIVAIPHYIGYNYFVGGLDNLETALEKEILSNIK